MSPVTVATMVTIVVTGVVWVFECRANVDLLVALIDRTIVEAWYCLHRFQGFLRIPKRWQRRRNFIAVVILFDYFPIHSHGVTRITPGMWVVSSMWWHMLMLLLLLELMLLLLLLKLMLLLYKLQHLLLLLMAQRVIMLHIRRVKFFIVTGGVTSVKVISI